MIHHFDTDVAERAGIHAACVAYAIEYWCRHKAANGRDIHDGKAWVYNSTKAWAELIPYMSEKQIRTALNKLRDEGLIEVRNLNLKQYDQTLWYAWIGLEPVASTANCPNGQLSFPNGQLDLPKRADAFAQKGEPIPVEIPYKIPSKKTVPVEATDEKPELDNLPLAFDTIWKAWSKTGRERSKAKPLCMQALKRAAKDHDLRDLTRAALRYAKATDPKFHKGLHTWIAGGFYENFMPPKASLPTLVPQTELSDLERAFDQFAKTGEWTGDRYGHQLPPNHPNASYPAEIYARFGIAQPAERSAA
jgi:hypothetical protein